jgi:hypothetical protein
MKSDIRAVVTYVKKPPDYKIPLVVRRPFDIKVAAAQN